MISTHLLQDLTEDKPLGFARRGGTMRYYCSRLDITRADWLATIDYALSRGWVEFTGQTDGAGKVYNWRGEQEETCSQ